MHGGLFVLPIRCFSFIMPWSVPKKNSQEFLYGTENPLYTMFLPSFTFLICYFRIYDIRFLYERSYSLTDSFRSNLNKIICFLVGREDIYVKEVTIMIIATIINHSFFCLTMKECMNNIRNIYVRNMQYRIGVSVVYF